MMDKQELTKLLSSFDAKSIKFSNHFHFRARRRPINMGMVIRALLKPDALVQFESQIARNQQERKYKIWLKVSSKYCLIVLVIITEKNLNILTAWNTNRKWKKTTRK